MSDTPHARYYLDSHREMADDRFDYDDTPQPRTFNRWDAPTPGNFGGSPIYSASSSPHRTLPPDRLGFLPFDYLVPYLVMKECWFWIDFYFFLMFFFLGKRKEQSQSKTKAYKLACQTLYIQENLPHKPNT